MERRRKPPSRRRSFGTPAPKHPGLATTRERDAGMDGPLRGCWEARPLFLLCLLFPWRSRCLLLLLLLLLAGAEQHAFDVSVWPENPVVENGASLWLNCSTSCQETDARGSLETSLTTERQVRGSNWAAFQLVNITEWASAPECIFSCDGKRKTVRANLTTYRLPELIELDPVPAMEVGKQYTLTCRVSNVAPVQKLSVAFLKRGKELQRQTFEEDAAQGAGDVVTNHTLTARRADRGEEVSCLAALDLRPDGPLSEKASLGKVLEVFAFPTDPRLQTPRYIEAGANTTVTCEVLGVFPADEAQFDLTFMGTGLDVSITVSGEHAGARAQVFPSKAGEGELNCTVSLGPVTRSAVEPVKVYSFPDPSLEIRPSPAFANHPVTVTCDSPATQLPNVSLLIKSPSGRILASGRQHPVRLTLTAQEKDDGRAFLCEVEMALGGNPIIKNASAQLTVFSVPEMDEATCPSNRVWVEGTRPSLRCAARGNPRPAVACAKDGGGGPVAEGDEERVTRSHAGVYRCTALSELGSSTRMVTVHVEYGPRLDESSCPSRQVWVAGSWQRLRCQAEGLPTPEISCAKDGAAYRAEKPHNVTQSHAGVYHCNATNVHGLVSRTVAVTVEYGPEMDDSSCPYNWTWTGGTERTFDCSARGNPEPTVECVKEGVAYRLGVLQRVSREHAGTYRCTALNVHGSVTRNVSVQVEYEPEMDESTCPSNWTLVEGAPPAFTCTARGVPPPVVLCTEDGVSHHLIQGEGIAVHSGTFWCNATNRHGTAAKPVTVVVETTPTLEESGCPGNQTWLEGTLRTLACEAAGTPTPRVHCSKEGAAEDFRPEQNVSRNDSGVYQCRAANSHGTDTRTVTVQVEYRPAISLLAVSAPSPVRRGSSFSVTCHADGVPAALYSWRVPQASNLHYAGHGNSTVTVTRAGGQNSGTYECTASNKHGQHLGQVEIQVEDHWLYIIVVLAIAAATTLVLGGMAGVIYYLKSTACKKGEYNVRDAENSTEATGLNRERAYDGDIYGIQLTRT